jgi:hypothetical protein
MSGIDSGLEGGRTLRVLRCPENGRFAQRCTHERPSDLLQRVPTVARRWADLVPSVRWEALARGTKQYPYPYMSVAVLDVAVRLLIIIVKHKLSQCLALRRNAPSDLLQRVPIVARRWADLVLSVRWEAVARGTKQFPYPDYLTSFQAIYIIYRQNIETVLNSPCLGWMMPMSENFQNCLNPPKTSLGPDLHSRIYNGYRYIS